MYENTRHIFEETLEKGLSSNFLTDGWIEGESYEMFAVRFETDCIDALYERLDAANVSLEPLIDDRERGRTFVYTDLQGNKFQVWQRPDTESQPIREGVPALIRVAALFFPVSDPEVSFKWYTESLGLEVNEFGQPITEAGEEIYFLKSLESGRTHNFYTGQGEIQGMSIVNIQVDGLDEMHRRLKEQGQTVQDYILDRQGCGRQFQVYDPDGNKLDMWEEQVVVDLFKEIEEKENWKDRLEYTNHRLNITNIDEFLKRVKEEPTGAIRTVQIWADNDVPNTKPELFKNVIETLEQFGKQNPEKALNLIIRY